MKLCHIVSHIDEEASGPSYSVPRLCQAVANCNNEVILATLDRGGGTRDLGKVQHKAFPQGSLLRKLGRSREMRTWLQSLSKGTFDIMHSHGLWMMPNLYSARAAHRSGIPHVIAPRGTLDPAALVYSRRRKQVVWKLGQEQALRSAQALHATSEEEASHFRALGLRNPIILSPNGIDIPAPCLSSQGASRSLLYLGRLHEKKGIDLLLSAWQRLQAQHPSWDLRIIGKGDSAYVQQLQQIIADLGLTRVKLENAIYGEEKLAAFRDADLFVLPTRGENFAMVVAEALASGTPVLTTTGAPWPEISERKCGWRTDVSADAIAASLDQALSTSPENLAEMGSRGRHWMSQSFAWDMIGTRMLDAYEWVAHGGTVPSNILKN